MTPPIITRDQWGSKSPLGPMMPPTPYEVFFHHSVTNPTNDPIADWRLIEQITIQRFGRMSYSFGIHPYGTILEGAGLTIGAHTQYHNSHSFGIVFIGNYQDEPLTDIQIINAAELVKFLQLHEFLTLGTRFHPGVTESIRGHRDAKPTACPGNYAYAQLPTIRALVAEEEETEMPYTQSQLIGLMQTAIRLEFLDEPPQGGESLRMVVQRLAREIDANSSALGHAVRAVVREIVQDEFLDNPPYGGESLRMVVQRFAREIDSDATQLNQALDTWWENGPKQELLSIINQSPDNPVSD